MTKLWYCDEGQTRGSDIVTEQERSHAISTRPRPHATERIRQSVLLHFRHGDIS